MDASFRDWAWLPSHIMDLVVMKLDRLSDYIPFCCVCPQWRYVAFETALDHKVNLDVLKESRKKLPLLMLKTDEKNDEYRTLYSVADGKTYTLKLPLPYKKRYVGSSFGWLLCVEENFVVTLVNPYNNGCISLPIFRDPREMAHMWFGSNLDYYITKGILLSDPHINPNSFEVVVIYGGSSGYLAFFKSGSPSWIKITSKGEICDIIYYKGKLYGITKRAELVEVDLHNGIIKTIIPRGNVIFEENYLVESQDNELLVVTRRWNWPEEQIPFLGDNEIPRSHEIRLFRVTHPIEEGSSLVETKDIGQQTLFLGDSPAMSVSTIEFSGCKPNALYYASQYHLQFLPYRFYGLNEDSGIFNLEDGSFNLKGGKFYNHHLLGSSYKFVQPPVWFVPN